MNIYTKFVELISNTGKRVFKLKGVGGSAVTAKEAMPWGYDGNPIKGTAALMAYTSNASERAVIGYSNSFQEAADGEVRIYSVDPEKSSVSSYVWCHTNGITEINGNQYSVVRYEPLNTNLADMVSQINAQLTAIQAGTTPIGGTYVAVPITLNINQSKSPTVKIK